MGSSEKIKVGVLTSSRADYGIYQPLLRQLHADPFFEIEVIAFGTHLIEKYGRTVDAIYQDGFNILEVANTMSQGDSPADISLAMAATMKAFSDFFKRHNYQLLFALGDRYEMFSAVAASVPFNIPIAHIHGGETTLGAIDNAFRHSITCLSKLHFTSTEIYRKRVVEITGNSGYVYNVGALSIDNLKQLRLPEVSEFKEKYDIDLSKPTILFTFHPETVAYEKNKTYIFEVVNALKKLSHYQIIVTMPNADTMGLMIRDELIKAAAEMPNIIIVETFGSTGYLSAMKHCSFMLGNTSSGFVEAAYFSKPVINLGERQRGRIITPNIFTIPIKTDAIIEAVKCTEKLNRIEVKPLYGNGDTAARIVEILKDKFNKDSG
jgi:GDP/UDP-N,N'-diacetylbacillosamine 2-epimerase (hydrolysing)